MSTPRDLPVTEPAASAVPEGPVADNRAVNAASPIFTAILTRPAGQSAPLAKRLTDGGVPSIDFPLIGILPAEDTAPLQAVLAAVEASPIAYRLIFFVSPNAVTHAFAYAASQGVDLARIWALQAASASPSLANDDGDGDDPMQGVQHANANTSLTSPATERGVAPASVSSAVRHPAFTGAPWIAAVGPGTLMALAHHGIHASSHRLVSPDGAEGVMRAMREGDPAQVTDAVRFDSEALVAALDAVVPRTAWRGERVLILRGDGGREWFADLLREAGAQVDVVCAYRRMLPAPDAAAWRPIETLVDGDAPAAWVMGSSEAVRNLRALAEARFGEGERLRALLHMPVLAPHPRIAHAAERAGFDTIWHSDAGDLNLARAIFAASERLTKKQNTDGMTEENTGNTAAPAAHSPGTASPAGTTSAQRPSAPYVAGASPAIPHSRHAGMIGSLWLVVILAVSAGAAGGWWLNARFNHELDALRIRQTSGDQALADAREKSAQSLLAAHQLDNAFAALSGRINDTQTQQQALRQMYQDLARNRDDWVMTQAAQTLSSANQQLQLTGDVHMALYALQNADTELSTSSAPQVLDVRRAIAADIDKLKAVQVVDVPGLALRLDQAIAKVDDLPLSGDVSPRADASATAAVAASGVTAAAASSASDTGIAPWYKGGVFTAAYWRAAWATLTHRASDSASRMVTVRRIDRSNADAMLIAPDQDAYLRQNVTLRLLSARLSLLSRNEASMQSDLAAADDALARYFDPSSPSVGQVRETIASVRGAARHVDIPTLDGSLQALRQNMSRG
ncbi:uroporphyrinogen III methyltransferase/synthase [Robbsia andropogonis]|uniref:fused uroporphyrinogen-III synthase HemD/membrane protein HemX n=1 Tax=Robbsia andropogonis TaxID=28092 RepID=UPI000699069E|nr:fused uroporphyrinogen-III synthase HemD/membrane protein HemX [Robbsia andropogonis]MCP1116510.1 fused uroporphyrinogen-III synthase HemD/membrane protein HemX [Robbsia andropogonis]MCP1126811.1 fused uroporphyrinogen-III synthase HemD/membrane protein HemX [Robbsia andropogonis]